jgi:hypothetical protein
VVERKGARAIFIRQDCQGMQNLLKPANLYPGNLQPWWLRWILVDLHVPISTTQFSNLNCNCQPFHEKARDLEMWLKIQNGKVTASLPKGSVGMQHRHIATDEAARWEEYNMAALGGQHSWETGNETGLKPLAERNVWSENPYFWWRDVLTVKEYLSVATWHASPKGICEVVRYYAN